MRGGAIRKVLVIKLAALGDVVQAFACLPRIRAAHPAAEITVLTTPVYGDLFALSPDVDRVEADGRPKRLGDTLAMLRRVRAYGYDRIYDLQTSTRSSAYFYGLLPNPPAWSGIAPGCALPHANPHRDHMHTLERQADQLRFAGIWPDAPIAPGTAPPPDLSFLLDAAPAELQPERFGLFGPFALLIPGASAHRPGKRWPAERYGDLARRLAAEGIRPAVVGAPAEGPLAALIRSACPEAADLTGQTSLSALAVLGAHARVTIGNDTGPTHLVAAAGTPTLALFSAESDPALCAPRGRRVEVLRENRLDGLSVDRVATTVEALRSTP